MIYTLLADDHPEASLIAMAAGEDIEVHVAVTADEALAALRAWRPDAVILDLGLTDDDGAFVRTVRALYAGRLVVASAADPCEIRRVCSLVGAHPLPKPYLARDLLRAVRGDV